jgi:DNA polymerase-3 subunit beta
MRFTIQRQDLIKPLQHIVGVVERRQTLPVLSNVLLIAENNVLSMTATDLEVEIITTSELDITEQGAVTIPARKFVDICKALPDGAQIELHTETEKERITIRSGKSRFTLSTLPVDNFPRIDNIDSHFEFSVPQKKLKAIIDATQFSMAQQDVRFYLNGLMVEVGNDVIKAVATDGHRLSYSETKASVSPDEVIRVVVPRKGVNELSKLLQDSDTTATVTLGTNHIHVGLPGITFTSKLIDGQFPDYNRVIPKHGDKKIVVEKEQLRQVLNRTSILSNEKYRGIRIKLEQDVLQAQAHNPEMEEAEEEMPIDYSGDALEIGFNVNYLLDALTAVQTKNAILTFADSNSSCLVQPEEEDGSTIVCQYVVMPMRL